MKSCLKLLQPYWKDYKKNPKLLVHTFNNSRHIWVNQKKNVKKYVVNN